MEPTSVIVKPIITEKTSWAAGRHNAYTFEIHPDANKQMVREAVQKMFKVKVAQVRTINRKGKARRTRYGISHRPDKRRAIVVLAGDDRIELF